MVNGVYGGNFEGNEFPNARRHNPLYDTPPVSRRTNHSHLLGNLIRRTFNQVATSGKRGNLLTKGFRG